MDSLIGKTLDEQYRLDELIGVGGMANVYRAQDLVHDRTVAVKVLREESLNNDELVRRFKNESKAISILNHPNIVKVYDVSTSGSLYYIVMEYVEGITLKEYLRRRGQPLTWREAVHFTCQILRALEHAHENGVVHRDIKPQNIMLMADGSLKIMDFGIARLSRSECQTMTDKAIGSVHYISPEQAKGDVTDAKADIYSVGVTLYEMLSGRLPFEADSIVSVAMKQIQDTPQPLTQLNPDIPAGLADITCRAMAKDPAQRYPSAAQMLADIERFKENPSIRFDTPPADATARNENVVNQTKKGGAQPQGSGAQNGKPPVRKKRRKKHSIVIPVMLGMALAFALGSAFLCYQIFATSDNVLFSKKPDVDLVDFVGMTREEVEGNKQYSQDFTLVFEEEYNKNYEVGVIYEQTPRPPKEVKQGQTVTLKVSKGVEYVEVPNVDTLTRDSAQQKMKEVGLNISIRPDRESSAAMNTVTRTDPVAGTQVARGDTVILYIAQPKIETEREVPNIVGLSLGDATKALSSANLLLGTATEEYSTTVPEGTIISQSIQQGTKVKMRTKIDYTTSIGKPPVTLRLDSDPATYFVGEKTTFTATVTGAKAEDVKWDINGTTGSGATFTVQWPKEGNYTVHAEVGGTTAEITITVQKSTKPTPAPTTPPASSGDGDHEE